MIEVGVVIPIYGNPTPWEVLARRAMSSAVEQDVPAATSYRCILSYGNTLQEARNDGAKKVDAEWLIFLDADDELAPGYVDAMLTGTADIRQPSTLGISDGVEDDEPYLLRKTDLTERNYIVIGAMVNAEKFFQVGGFRDLPCLEDWDLWGRMWKNGATIQAIPEAVYRVHVRTGSRNTMSNDYATTYSQIRRELKMR